MRDVEFLLWLHDRLTDVHGEDPIVDYMHKLRAIIASIPMDRDSNGIWNNAEEIRKYIDLKANSRYK
jgi:hypothetical protein